MDMFELRTLLMAVEEMKPARTFLKSTFFSDTATHLTPTVDIDVFKGRRRMAPFVSNRIGSKTMENIGYTTNTYKPPLVSPDYPFTGEDLQVRLPGENIYSGIGPDDRLARLIGNKLAEFDDTITRREEWMCAQALFTGKIPVVGEGVNQTIDFGFTNTVSLTTKNKWNYTASDLTGDPIMNLKQWKRQLIQACGINPTHVVMSPDAGDAFMAHPAVQKYFNLFNANFGILAPRPQDPNGMNFIAHINEIGLDIVTYEEWYVDPTDDTEKPMIPAGSVLMASKNASFKMAYGAVVDVSTGTFALPRVPKSWIEEKPPVRYLQLSSRPLPIPTLVDSYLVASVL